MVQYIYLLKEDLIWQSNMTNSLNQCNPGYYEDHKDLGVRGCAENLGIGYSTLTKWLKDFRESGDIPVRGSGNYASDEQKEIARLKRELRDALFHFHRVISGTVYLTASDNPFSFASRSAFSRSYLRRI